MVSHLSNSIFSHHLVLEALNVDQLMHDIKGAVKSPLQHCLTCSTVRNGEDKRHIVYIEGTMILDIR